MVAKKKNKKDEAKSIMKGLPETYEIADLYLREKIPTPIPQLNWFFGGGVPFNTIVEAYGEPKGGKSTFVYGTSGLFCQKYKDDGMVVIIDSEWSADRTRLELMGNDFKMIYPVKAKTLDSGFESMIKIVNKNSDKKIMIIWDSIAMPPTRLQLENTDPDKKNPGGQNWRQRLMKAELQEVSTLLHNNVSIWLLNQIYTNTSGYGKKILVGGGKGLAHGKHYSFEMIGEDLEYEGFMASWKHSAVRIDKTKFTPEAKDLTMMINCLKGGIIDQELSALQFMINQEMLEYNNGRVTLSFVEKSEAEIKKEADTNDCEIEEVSLYKSYYRKEVSEMMEGNPDILEYFKFIVVEKIVKMSPYLRLIYSKMYKTDNIFEYVATEKEDLRKKLKLHYETKKKEEEATKRKAKKNEETQEDKKDKSKVKDKK